MEASAGQRLLVVDDDESLLEIFRLFMEREGFHVAAATDGLKGLQKAKLFKPHLIVLDLMMPNLNGFEVIHRLQQEGMGDVPIIVMTGFSDSANEALIREEPNVVDYLKKPIEYKALAERIRKILGA